MNIIDKNLSFRNGLPHNNTPGEIILHHTECNDWTVERLHELHRDSNGWSGIGYHYYVRKDGSIYKGRPDWTMGAHCKGSNMNSIGIAFEGRYHVETSMPNAQFNAGLELIQYLKNQYGNIPIYGHKERGSSDCPGQYFPLEDFRNENKVVNQTVVYSAPVRSNTKKLWEVSINGQIVRDLQAELNKQFSAGLKVDGWFGDSTLDKCITVRKGARGNITKIIQELLIRKGYNVSYGADGIFGQGTYNAILQLQKKNGLGADGIVGRNTWKALLKK